MIQILTVVSLVHIAIAARILGIFPIPSVSHQVVFAKIYTELAKRGHEVSIIAPYEIPDAPENLNNIDTTNIAYKLLNQIDLTGLALSIKDVDDVLENLLNLVTALNHTFIDQMNDTRVKNMLDDSNKYDLVMVEGYLMHGYGAAKKFKTPLVSIFTYAPEPLVYSVMGAPTHPFLYNMMNLNVDTKTIFGKLKTLYYYLYTNIIYSGYIKEISREIAENIFGEISHSTTDLTKEVDLVLINSYPIVTGLRPTVSTIVNIGGVHMQEKKPLPEDLKKYLDDSMQGVVYMSLGSNVQSKNLPKEKLNIFLDVFKELPYNVLWKYEDNNLTDIPKNIKTQKWLPQNDLLAHPNVKVFITQGGLQSMEEAIHNKVPLIGIPFICDQKYNARRFRELHIGIDLNFHTLKRENFRNAILSVINNESYKNNITQLSKYIKDEQTPALDRAIWWIEYVIRHGGTKHLADPSTKINMFEYLMLDLLTVAIVLFVLIYFAVRLVIKNMFNVKLKIA